MPTIYMKRNSLHFCQPNSCRQKIKRLNIFSYVYTSRIVFLFFIPIGKDVDRIDNLQGTKKIVHSLDGVN